MVRQLKVDIAARAARLRFVALAWLASACGGSPVAPADEPEAEPQVVDIVAEPVTMAESAQLLDNASMEAGASLPDEWWSGAPDGSDIVVEWIDTAAASGSRSLSIRRDSLATTGFAFWAQTLEVDNPVGVTFELSVSIQLADVFGEGVSIAIRGDNSALGNCCAEAFATTQGRRTIAGTHDWTIHTVKLNSVPADVDRITVYFVFLPNTSGTALFDDATLSASVTVPTLELQNTDMENGDGYPEPWWWGGPGYENYDFVWSNAEASSGGRSLQISRGQRHPEQFGFWAQTIDAANYAGGSATLTVSAKTTGLAGQGAAIAIRTDDTPQPRGRAEAFATTQGSQPILGTTGWLTYQVTLSNIPANSRSLTVYLIHLTATDGAIYFDEVTLAPS